MSELTRKALISAAIIGIVALVGYLIFSTKTVTVEVIGHDWRREIQVEDFQTRQFEAWDEAVPTDARELACWREQRGSHQQYTGQTCTGTGSRRTCTNHYMTIPDYDNRCSFLADRWGYERSIVSTSQRRDDTPYWLSIDFTTCESLGCEREGQHLQEYRVLLRDRANEQEFNCSLEQDLWASFYVGQSYTLVTRRFYSMPFCESLHEVTP